MLSRGTNPWSPESCSRNAPPNRDLVFGSSFQHSVPIIVTAGKPCAQLPSLKSTFAFCIWGWEEQKDKKSWARAGQESGGVCYGHPRESAWVYMWKRHNWNRNSKNIFCLNNWCRKTCSIWNPHNSKEIPPKCRFKLRKHHCIPRLPLLPHHRICYFSPGMIFSRLQNSSHLIQEAVLTLSPDGDNTDARQMPSVAGYGCSPERVLDLSWWYKHENQCFLLLVVTISGWICSDSVCSYWSFSQQFCPHGKKTMHRATRRTQGYVFWIFHRELVCPFATTCASRLIKKAKSQILLN